MDYEKLYKNALERMKSWARGEHTECFSEAKKAAEFIFPELAESEDEKIRKWIRKELESKYVVDNIVNNRMADKAFAWLEKQGEQKSDWSEEDETNLTNTIIMLKEGASLHFTNSSITPCVDWLKSFKPNHWKPSEYDISLLEEIARNIRNNIRPFCSEVSSLEVLIDTLKNL